MEITKDNFAEVSKTEEFKSSILPLITGLTEVQSLIENKATVKYRENIDEEIKNVHSQYDEDMFTILGERPGQNEDGSKQKTYDKLKVLFGELKDLRGQKDSLTKDAEVQRLQGEIEKLKTEGGAKHVQEVFDQAKKGWETEREGFETKISEMQKNNETFKKMTEIKSAVQSIKFNPDTTESVRKLVLENAERKLIENSKFENDNLVFLDGEGKVTINQESFKPKNAFEMLMSMDAIKDITLKDDNKKPGGGADETIKGSIKTTSVDGKDTKKLILAEGSFKTKREFNEIATKSLIDSGIAKNDPDYTKLLDEAYKDYNVAELPFN